MTSITPDALITINMGLMLTLISAVAVGTYKYAKLELTQQFHKAQLDSAFEKIRNLEAKK